MSGVRFSRNTPPAANRTRFRRKILTQSTTYGGFQSGETTSPPARVAKAGIKSLAEYEMNRTLPSARAKLAPPGWGDQKWNMPHWSSNRLARNG